MSTNVAKVTHLLRAAGPEIPVEELAWFDGLMGRSLCDMLGGPLTTPAALERAACPVTDGGLGLRRACDLQYPAYLASVTEAKPLARELLSSLPAPIAKVIWARWGRVASQALEDWKKNTARASGGYCRAICRGRA